MDITVVRGDITRQDVERVVLVAFSAHMATLWEQALSGS